MKIAILVPFYNEEKNLISFIKEWETFLNLKKKFRNNLLFFFIDDGSYDNSVLEIKKNIKKLKYKVVSKKNSGHGNTCKFGYKLIVKKYKHYDYLLQIDSDNQCDPKYISRLYELIKTKKYNFIFGYRKKREDGFLRFVISRIMSFTLFIKKFLYIKDLNTPYRIMKISELQKVLNFLKQNKSYDKIELYNCVVSYGIKKTNTINWININFRNRYYGKSKYNFSKMFKMYINFILKI